MTFGCFAGFQGFDCSILWIIIMVIFFAAAMFRKNIAEGLLDMDFSLIGATASGTLVFIIMTYITHSMKWSGLIGFAGAVIGGFIGSRFLPDGSSSGGGEGGWF